MSAEGGVTSSVRHVEDAGRGMNTSEWLAFVQALRMLCRPEPLFGVVLVSTIGDLNRCYVSFSIIEGKVKEDGWSGSLPNIRKAAELLREAAALLDASAEDWVKTMGADTEQPRGERR